MLSLATNLENHPAKISEPPSARSVARSARAAPARLVLSAKTGLPLGVVGVTARAPRTVPEDESMDAEESVNLGAARAADETPEAKRARKAAVKESRRAARSSKKELKQVYTSEQVKAQKHATTNVSVNASITHIA